MTDMPRQKITVEEFHQLPESNQIIELIDGEIIVSPTPIRAHQQAVLLIASWILEQADGGEVNIAPLEVHFDAVTILEPDVFYIAPDNPHCKLGENGYFYGAPDLVVEVLSPSTAARDRKEKYEIYQRFGVREYWLVDVLSRYLEVYQLIDGKFSRLGVYRAGETFTSSVLNKTVDVGLIFN